MKQLTRTTDTIHPTTNTISCPTKKSDTHNNLGIDRKLRTS